MTQVSHEDERPQTALVPVQPASPGPCDTPGTGVQPVTPPGRHRAAPCPRRAPGPAAVRPSGAPLPALGGEFLAASLALLCRDEPLSPAEIGDHADVVAEVADALAAVADRLAQDLALSGSGTPDLDAGGAVDELTRARDALQQGSAHGRRSAAALWARHIESLRTRLESTRALTHAAQPPQ